MPPCESAELTLAPCARPDAEPAVEASGICKNCAISKEPVEAFPSLSLSFISLLLSATSSPLLSLVVAAGREGAVLLSPLSLFCDSRLLLPAPVEVECDIVQKDHCPFDSTRSIRYKTNVIL